MNLAIGELVVYGAHGAGRITARESREILGEQQQVIVLALARGLSVELPLARAEELLRPLAGADDIARLGEVLRSAGTPDGGPWPKRQREARAKLGSAIGLAQIVTDGAQRPSLSPNEREFVQRAKELLAVEIALSRGEDTSAAGEWIDEQLAATSRPPSV